MTMKEKLVGLLSNSDIGRKLIRESEADILAKRQEHVAAIPEIRKQEAEALAPVQKIAKQKQAAFDKAHSKLSLSCVSVTERLRLEAAKLTAEADLLEAKQAVARITGPADAAVALHENELVESAPQELADFQAEMTRLFDDSRHTSVSIQSHRQYDPVHDKHRTTAVFSNTSAKGRRLGAITRATQRAGEMKLEATAVEDVAAELQTLRDSIPAGDEYESNKHPVGALVGA